MLLRTRAKRPTGVRMPSPEQTRRVIGDYFRAMDETGHFAQFFTDDVTWTTIDTNAVVRGPRAVQDFTVALHASMPDLHTDRLVFSDDCAYLEGSCAGMDGQRDRIRYCLAYDLIGSQIASMRFYGLSARFMP
jgi:SnoaL-like domain